MSTQYVVSGELTGDAVMGPDLLKRCSFAVGPNIPIRTKKDESQTHDETSANSRQYHQKFIEVTYPDGNKSGSVTIPEVVIHHEHFVYYGKPTVYVGIPQWFVQQLELKLTGAKEHPIFQDKTITSDNKHWWTKFSFSDAAEGKEYIRTYVDENNDDYYGNFIDFFNEYPTSVVCNVTCSVKMGTDTDLGTVPRGGETWRAGLSISMVTPYDDTNIPAPATGSKAKSALGPKDRMRKGLLAKRVNMN